MTPSAAIAARAPRHPPLLWALGAGAVVFGAMTLLSGGYVLFAGPTARAEAGAVVDFVLVFNFGAGFVYVAAGVAAALGKRWALHLARVLAGTTLLMFATLGVHIAMGGLFETRTLVAMTLRSAFWVGQALALARVFKSEAVSLPNYENHKGGDNDD